MRLSLHATIRILCGLLVFVSGLLNLGLFGWEPPIAEGDARQFQIAMHDAGYFLPVMTAIFLTAGASFIVNRYAALMALALAPISVNILLYHSLLGAGQAPVAAVFFAANAYMLWQNRNAYAPLFKARNES